MGIKEHWKQLLGALLAAAGANLAGVPLFFNPIAEGDVGVQLVHPAVGFFAYVALCVLLFHWAAVQLDSPHKAAFVVAASQFILIVDMTLAGKRGLATAGAGAVLLAVTWVCVSFVYSFLGRLGEEGHEKTAFETRRVSLASEATRPSDARGGDAVRSAGSDRY